MKSIEPSAIALHNPNQLRDIIQSVLDDHNQISLVPPHFIDPVGHFTTNEIDYPSVLEEIKVRGGIHLAVMGGMDPVLGQMAVALPDLTLAVDINPEAITHIKSGRIEPIRSAKDSKEYWSAVATYFRQEIAKIQVRYDYPIDQDAQRGWSSLPYFTLVKSALEQDKLKFIPGDICKEGLATALNMAKRIQIPISLIYVSNIFDYPENNRAQFILAIKSGIRLGLIAQNVQIIDVSGMKTRIYNFEQYCNNFEK